ncbi:MAG TPA: 2-isopropylmalate synthase [Armatimonadota bacterium]|nr:2-isopropylmalate synthase [Armatimonadota bacterium]
MARQIRIFDTTLRDGEQSPGASLTPSEKLRIAHQLSKLNVDVIEAGFPIASVGDFEAVRAIAQEVQGPEIAGLCRAVPGDIDRAWEALQYAGKPRIHTFIATSDIHLKHKLKRTRDQVRKAAVDAVARARSYTPRVEFSAEDAVRSDFGFLCEMVSAVIDAGASVVNIPDTVGYSTPSEFGPLIGRLMECVPNVNQAVISVHCHNDLGLAVANSLAAVEHGAQQVECTINGLGERAGNASLEEIVMALKVREDLYDASTGVNTRQLYPTSRLVSSLTGIAVQPNKAIVGDNAFAHEAGIHQHGVLQAAETYEIMDARSIGRAESQLVLGKHSGRHAFERHLRELGYELGHDDLNRAFYQFKELADKKKQVSDRDIEFVVADAVAGAPEALHLEYLHVATGMDIVPTATVRLLRNGQPVQEARTGVGSVDAVYRAIAKLSGVKHQLVDFTVQSVTGGTDALADVTVRVSWRNRVFTGRGSSMDVIEASAKAYVQAVNRVLLARDQAAKR